MQNIGQVKNKKHRPVGVIVLAFSYFFLSLFMLCVALPANSFSAAQTTGEAAGRIANQIFWLWCEALIGLAAGIGLWILTQWGRWLAMAQAGLGILSAWWMNSADILTGSAVLQTLIAAALLVYFFQPSVRETFATSRGVSLFGMGEEMHFFAWRTGRTVGLGLLLLLSFSFGVCLSHSREELDWTLWRRTYSVGFAPNLAPPCITHSCIGQNTYRCLCFFYKEGPNMCF